MTNKKMIIGILGGVGSGKSVVSRAFGELGCGIVDADRIAHEVLDLPEVVAAVVDRFGASVQGDSGTVNRSALGQLVFDDPAGLAFLNGLVHPRVLERCEGLIERYQGDPDIAAIVLDMPLLVEVGWEKKCDFLVFVECDLEKRLARASKNGKIDRNQLKKREKCQISLDKKRHIAHYRVHNNSEISDVTEQVAQLFSSIAKGK